jgi:Flp pilus assembly pilin Flp
MDYNVVRRRVVCAVSQFVADERGQDLMEYVLLSLFIGLAGLATLNAIGVSVGSWYGTSNTSVNGLWTSPNPTAS